MLETIPELTIAQTTGGALTDPAAAAAIAVGLAAFGAGYAERGIGSAAMGAIAEDEDLFVRGLVLTVIPETIVILALVVFILA
ncbi:MAG: ATP synthase subunit C [uncultured archaeon A07HR60]|jgi:ATP synthase subunit C.|nr:MAG: ATP synthase subunit C [uncultured archaeon A07HR60]